MAPVKEVYCKKCDSRHSRPVGKRCTAHAEESNKVNSDISIAASQVSQQPSALDTILQKLQQIEARQEQMAAQVLRLESDGLSHTPRASTPTRQPAEKFTDEGIVPTLDFLKSTNAVQEEVARRLRLLESDNPVNNTGKPSSSSKSGRFRTFNTNITKYIQWPQENVFIGASRKPIAYDDLNPQQFILGHLTTAMSANTIDDRDNMIHYIIKLLRESIDGSFDSSRGAHAIVLQELERGSIAWADTNKIDEIRALYSRKVSTSEGPKRVYEGSSTKKVVCSHYNKGKCTKATDHVTNSIMYRHVCIYCYKVTSKFFGHSEMECNRKAKQGDVTN